MAYTKLGIINLALGKMGVAKIVGSLTEDTAERIAATTVYDYVLDQVLEARPWFFARTRTRLYRASITPAFGFNYAYILPSDFIRFVRPEPNHPPIYPITGSMEYKVESMLVPDGLDKITNGGFESTNGWTVGSQWGIIGGVAVKSAGDISTLSQAAENMVSAPIIDEVYLLQFDVNEISGGMIVPSLGGMLGIPVSTVGTIRQYIRAVDTTGLVFTPSVAGVICTLDNVSVMKCLDKTVLLINYEDSNNYPLYCTYIRRVTDPSRYTPSFAEAFASRLGAEMSLKLTESMSKYTALMGMYMKELANADAVSQSMGSMPNETGGDAWESAGR